MAAISQRLLGCKVMSGWFFGVFLCPLGPASGASGPQGGGGRPQGAVPPVEGIQATESVRGAGGGRS